jgi:hypothetical protein
MKKKIYFIIIFIISGIKNTSFERKLPFIVLYQKILGSSFGINLSQKYSPFKVVFICDILLLASVLIVSFMENLAGYIVVYMICFGVTSGMIYLIPIRIAWVYFPNKKGKL